MPVYEYYCGSCEHKYEAIRTVSRMDEPVPCPKCDEPGHRQLSTFAFKDGRYGRFYGKRPSASSSSKSPDGPQK